MAAVLLGMVAAVLTSCGTGPAPAVSTTTQPPPRGVVFGVVSAGPTCPVERKGHPCPPRRLSGVLVKAERAGGVVVAETSTAGDGSFSLLLPPGLYELVVTPGGILPRCPTLAVSVRAGADRRVSIGCDTGIR